MDEYFPRVITKKTHPAKVDTAIFHPLNHHEWPLTWTDKYEYIPGSIKELSRLLNVEYDQSLQDEFNSLVASLLEDDLFCDEKQDDSLMFWVMVLRKYDGIISQRLKTLILGSGIMPMSSSDSERSFSTMNL